MKFEWKMGLAMCVLALAVFPLVAADVMPRSEWHNLVSECAQNAQTLRESYGVAVKKGNTALLEAINQILDPLVADGTFDQFFVKHVEASSLIAE